MKRAADFRAMARGCLRGRWLPAVGVTLVASLLGAWISIDPTSFITNIFNGFIRDNDQTMAAPGLLTLFIVTAQLLIGCMVIPGLVQYNLQLSDGKYASIGHLFCRRAIWGKAIWLQCRIMIFTFLWALLLVVPGIIKSYSYSMSAFILSEHPDMSAKDAMEASKRMMNGNKWRLFCLKFSFIGWMILSVITAGIGAIWLAPYMNAAITEFYKEVAEKDALTA